MYEVDLESVDLGEWFSFRNSHFDQKSGEWIFEEPIMGKNGPKVRVRRLQPFLQERMNKRKKVAEHVLNPKSRSMERIAYFPELSEEAAQKEMDDTWDHAITDFVNFKNKKTDEIIECTRENKLIMIKVPVFNRFIGNCLELLEGSEEKKAKDAEKN